MGKSASQKTRVTEYRMSMHLGICQGPVDSVRRIFVDEKVAWSGNAANAQQIAINSPELFGGLKKEGGVGGIAYLLPGEDDQVLPGGLASRMGRPGSDCPAYRGVTSIFFVGEVGSSSSGIDWASDRGDYQGYIGELDREVRGAGATYKGFYWGHNTPFIRPVAVEVEDYPRSLDLVLGTDLRRIGSDANPAHIIYECLVDDEFGMGAPDAAVDASGSFAKAAQTLFDEQFGLSMIWAQQSTIREFIQEVLDHIQGLLFIDPETGKWTLVLLRDDYDAATVPVLDMDNSILKTFQRKGWGDVANEVVVTYTNPENEKEETVSLQDDAAVSSQGGVTSTSKDFHGIRDRDLALRVCARELRQSTAPLAVLEVDVPRGSWQFKPGRVVRFDWAEHELNGLIFRVMRSTESATSAHIRVAFVEDVFSLSAPSVPAAPTTGWESPGSDPELVQSSQIFTLPYQLMSRTTLAAGSEGFVYPEALAGVMAYHESADVYEVETLSEVTRPNGMVVYEEIADREVATLGVLTSPLAAETESAIDEPPGADIGRTPVEGGFALISGADEARSELCLVKANPAGGWMLQRGIWDTVPRNWSAGALIWFFNSADEVADTSRVRGAGEVARYKLLARTSRGILNASAVPPTTGTVSDRPHRPSRPANVRVNGVQFGVIPTTGASDLVVTWARRNRLFEDAIPLAWDAGDVLPERGQTTNIRILDQDGNLIKAYLDLPGTEKTIPVSDLGGATAAFLQVFSARDDLASLQAAGFWLLADGVTEPSLPAGHDDLDPTLPGTDGIIQSPSDLGRNLCPDPYFQNPVLWGFGSGPWHSVGRLGSTYPGQMGAPKVALLSDEFYAGSAQQALATPIIGGLFAAGKQLELSARAMNVGGGVSTASLELTFHRSTDGEQVGDAAVLTWAKADPAEKSLTVEVPAGADARRFRVYNEDGEAWGGDFAITDVSLVEFDTAGSVDIRDRLNVVRDRVNAHFDQQNEFFDEALAQLTDASASALDESTLNWVRDPLFETGISAWKAFGGITLPSTGTPRGVLCSWPVSGPGIDPVRFLRWPGRKSVGDYSTIQAGFTASGLLNTQTLYLRAAWFDEAEAFLGFGEIAQGSAGVIEGVIEAPENAAFVEIHVFPEADAEGQASFILTEPTAAYALPGQSEPNPFVAPQDEVVTALHRMSQVVSGLVRKVLNIRAETRAGRAGYRELHEVVANETGARVSALTQLATDFNTELGNYYTSAEADQLFMTESGVNGSIAAYDLSLNTSFTNTLEGYTTRAYADQTFVTQSDVNGSIASFDLNLNTSFTNALGNFYTKAEADQRFYTSSDVNGAIASYDLNLNTSFTNALGNVYTKAEADQRFFTSSDVNGAIASFNLNLNTSFTNALDNVYTKAEADQRFYTSSDVNGAIASYDLTLNTSFTNTLAGYVTSSYAAQNFVTQSGLDGAISTWEVSGGTTLGNFYSSYQQTAQSVDGISSNYSLVLDANGVITGMELNADQTGASIKFRADTFTIWTSGTASQAPFQVVGGVVKMTNVEVDTIKANSVVTESLNGNAVTEAVAVSGNSGASLSTAFTTVASLNYQSKAGGRIRVAFTIKVGNGATQNVGCEIHVVTPGGTRVFNRMLTKQYEDTISATFSMFNIPAGTGNYQLRVRHQGGQSSTNPVPVPDARTYDLEVEEAKR